MVNGAKASGITNVAQGSNGAFLFDVVRHACSGIQCLPGKLNGN
jgi:hypothetical protein